MFCFGKTRGRIWCNCLFCVGITMMQISSRPIAFCNRTWWIYRAANRNPRMFGISHTFERLKGMTSPRRSFKPDNFMLRKLPITRNVGFLIIKRTYLTQLSSLNALQATTFWWKLYFLGSYRKLFISTFSKRINTSIFIRVKDKRDKNCFAYIQNSE